MNPEVQKLMERVAALEAEAKKSEKLFDVAPIMRPTIVGPMVKVYESDTPLLTWASQQNIPTVPTSLQRTYKVIDDLGPVFTTEGETGSVTPAQQAAGTCTNRIDINFCQRDYRAFRVSVEACVVDTDVDVPLVQNRDAQPAENVRTVGDYRDVKLGEAMRQAKDFLLNQGLGNALSEPESLETMINQNTTPNIVDNVGQSAFEFAMLALLAQIGLTTHANSYIRANSDMVWYTHPLVEFTMSRRAALPGLEEMYSVNGGVVSFMGIPVLADRNVFVNATSYLTSIFLLRRGHVSAVEQFAVDKEYRINEAVDPDHCEDDCTRLVNYMTGIARGLAKLGRVINVRPMLINTIISGHTGQINQPNAGTTLGGV